MLGIGVDHGALVVDRAKLRFPGDSLHNAGHFALLLTQLRQALHGNVDDDGGMEMGAIARSCAAAAHLELSPAVLFYEVGYRGCANSLIENFTTGCYLGVPILVWRGLTHALDLADVSEPRNPRIKRWMCK